MPANRAAMALRLTREVPYPRGGHVELDATVRVSEAGELTLSLLRTDPQRGTRHRLGAVRVELPYELEGTLELLAEALARVGPLYQAQHILTTRRDPLPPLPPGAYVA